MISPSSFWILLAEVLRDLESLGAGLSFLAFSGESLVFRLPPPPSRDIWKEHDVRLIFHIERDISKRNFLQKYTTVVQQLPEKRRQLTPAPAFFMDTRDFLMLVQSSRMSDSASM